MWTHLRLLLPGEKFSGLFRWIVILLKSATVWGPGALFDGLRETFVDSEDCTDVEMFSIKREFGLVFLIAFVLVVFALYTLVRFGGLQPVHALTIGYVVYTVFGFVFNAITAD